MACCDGCEDMILYNILQLSFIRLPRAYWFELRNGKSIHLDLDLLSKLITETIRPSLFPIADATTPHPTIAPPAAIRACVPYTMQRRRRCRRRRPSAFRDRGRGCSDGGRGGAGANGLGNDVVAGDDDIAARRDIRTGIGAGAGAEALAVFRRAVLGASGWVGACLRCCRLCC